MNLEKLKDTARKLEQKEDWRKAIEVYLKAIQQAESGAETSPDLSLYNRVGDLYLKINDTAEAVRSYERAVDLYADQGFFNNAIALCGKILRVNPGRTQTYLKLCQLHARKNVVSEAKRNLIEFLERMNALGQLDQAFQAVKLFADQFSGSQEIRSMLVDLLRATSRGDEARDQLEKMAHDLEAAGDKTGARKTRERIQGIEPEHSTQPANPPASAPPRRGGDLIFLDTGVDVPTAPPRGAPSPPRPAKEAPRIIPEPPAPEPEPVMPEGLLTDDSLVGGSNPSPDLIIDPVISEEAGGGGSDSLLGIERLEDSLGGSTDSLLGADSLEVMPDLTAPLDIQRENSASLDFEPMRLEGMEGTSLGGFSAEPQPGPLDFSDDLVVSLPDSETLQDPFAPDPTLSQPSSTADLPPVRPRQPTGDTLADLENQVLDDPENPDIHLQLAEKLLTMGESDRVAEELELALAGYEDRQDWSRASEMADRLVELAPDSIAHHQKRVELAYRTGDRAPLLSAYMGLGDALAKSGAIDKATAVYGRVIEHDPGNAKAAAALARLAPPAPPAKSKPAAAAPKAPAPPPPQPKTTAPSPPPRRAPDPPAKSAPAAAASTSSRKKPEPVAEGDFIDLGSMVRDDHNQRDTRMRVSRRDPTGQDEQREFHEILEQFKRGIDENLESDDYQSHYDLGVAFKEMGLLDEAIGEFQKALRATEGRLRTSEALGMAFFEKGQYAVCESVLRRAVDSLDGSDEAKIGLLYWLGRAAEAQGKKADAVASYERAMAVDIRFMDLSQRMQRLAGGRRQ